jgi:uncharacterized protein (DUF58 family)
VAAIAARSHQRLDSNRDMNDGRSRERPNERALRAEQYLAPETLGTLAPFELRARMIVEGVMSGMHRSPYQSLAVEFAEHRQYAPGDSIRQIDWKVFARTDKMYVKRYVQETNLDVMVLVDRSSSMRFGTLPVKKGWGGTDPSRERGLWTKFDHATATAAALAYLCSIELALRAGILLHDINLREKSGNLAHDLAKLRRGCGQRRMHECDCRAAQCSVFDSRIFGIGRTSCCRATQRQQPDDCQ